MTKNITCLEDVQKLPQPMSKEIFEKCKQAILEESCAGIISRVQLDKLLFFISRNTLRNLDCNKTKEGIKNPIKIGTRKYVYYRVEDVLEYIERVYCTELKQKIDKAYIELENYLTEQRRIREENERRSSTYYKDGRLKNES
ncbi:MAG: hypothetical protein J6W96_04705 [Alphaproteobacteria bacterium]|nr:hypothetical protein [Alphaproteobacteria bacterium]